MAKTANFSLKLLIDEKRNRVVLAEAGPDFVDVLYSLLTLPMGTIARLLEKHQKLPQVLGCYKNLNTSVKDMVVDDFETEACKSMLMHPKSTKEIHCRRLKLNIDDTEATKFFVCSNVHICKAYSNFNTTRCSSGHLMATHVQVPEKEQVVDSMGNNLDGVFVNCRSSFIITDDMKVTLNSIDDIVEVVSGLGYSCLSDLRETLLDVGFQEVLTLLANMFASDSPLTCTFLGVHCMTRMQKTLSPRMLKTERVEQGRGCHVKVFVRKPDMKILYAECSEDFVDSLLTFLVLPLDLASSFSKDDTILGCVRNLCRGGCRRVLGCGLPHYYSCSKKLLDIHSSPSQAYECYDNKFARWIDRSLVSSFGTVVTVSHVDPKKSISGTPVIGLDDIGFVKRKTRFIISDDLIITPMHKFSTIGLLKKMQINMKDIEARPICIYQAELINILSASMTSSSALTNGLSYLLAKEPKKET